jgi:hypothetical protein
MTQIRRIRTLTPPGSAAENRAQPSDAPFDHSSTRLVRDGIFFCTFDP